MTKQGAEAEKPVAAAPGKPEGQPPQDPPAESPKKGEGAKGPKGAAPATKGAGNGEPAATPSLEQKHKELQKAHEGALSRIKDLEATQSVNEALLKRLDSFERRLNTRDGEVVMDKIQRHIDAGDEKSANALADRELARRAAVLGIKLDDPQYAYLKAVGPRDALHQFMLQEPYLTQQAAAAPAKPPEPGKPQGDTPPAPPAEERIGGKTLKELEIDFAKKHGLFANLPDQPAGQTTQGFGTGSADDLFRQGLQQLHDR